MGGKALQEAFRAVARADFLRPADRRQADLDAPIAIGDGQTNSQPRTVYAMLELLDVQRGNRVLDVGSGSGWTTALLAHLVGPEGLVVGVEIDPPLVEFGAENLRGYDFSWASIRQATPGVLGAPDQAPFNRVLVSADASDLPSPLIEQLEVGGLMVVPVRSRMTRVVKTSTDHVEATTHGLYSFVPLLWP
ncbi:MAG TPA: protein-L-isoaspartate O-methyltransferase [Aeromicrobium sp.]|nr:protein-L-isoaspartate O-methyltransferase [Aeromicrobium sp.]